MRFKIKKHLPGKTLRGKLKLLQVENAELKQRLATLLEEQSGRLVQAPTVEEIGRVMETKVRV